jgi:hypothetical protein
VRKSFELFDHALEASVLDDLGCAFTEESANAVAASVRSTSWWSSDTSATAQLLSPGDGDLMNDALAGAAWAGVFCSFAEPRWSLSLSAKLNNGQTAVSSNTIVLALWRNCLVLFDAPSLNAKVAPALAHDKSGLWVIYASRPSGEQQ